VSRVFGLAVDLLDIRHQQFGEYLVTVGAAYAAGGS